MKYISIQDISKQQIEELSKEHGNIYYADKSKVIQLGQSCIGFYTSHILFDKLTLEYNLFERYRHQGYGFSLVNIATEMVSKENPTYDSIYLLIHISNIPSISVALKNGYHECYDIDLQELVDSEMSNYRIYSKENEYYQKSEIPKQLLHKL